ncbi:MAG: sigma-54-dependent Fis family transcriptional regulator [SAR324 cluster bacterium]|uniref:Sigma-54-dependent Fis family transcriptional regulator n=1 Tax=SAR324 cluster bacterium TaxID=2024889 RepID=A0A7X9IJN0_9DELT|nr:sigma-54-dependent Fis family transcriptional regulator [SAR324 cluster bacterium]
MSRDVRILVAEDDPQMQLAIKSCLSRNGYDISITADGKSALEQLESNTFDLIISDQRMPEMEGQELLAELNKRESTTPFIMITAYGTINQAVEAMQLGAADFLTKPFSAEDLVRVVEKVLSPESKEFYRRGKKPAKGKAIITNDSLMIRILEVSEAVARSDATVLIQGESGTGKELIARLIHASSPRSNQSFVAVNCAALPSNLLESELFGHEKGSFTGALTRKIGKFELAHGGSLLLDEISEMEMSLQAKLLRVLQEREVDRVGGRDPISIDVRVIATTNRNLEEEVRAGRFRADLFYRLNVIPITLPPLRERKGDIKLLVEHFMNEFLGKEAPRLPVEVVQTLEEYQWPGNVRELQNAVERAAILSGGRSPTSSDFLLNSTSLSNLSIEKLVSADGKQWEKADEPMDQPKGPSLIRSGLTVAEMEKALIMETLRATSNNRTKAAELLGISIRTLRNKLSEYRSGSDDQ